MLCRTLVSLLAQEPLPAGDALLGQLWTPHLDTHQRILILDALSAAAHQMSHGPRALAEGPSQSTPNHPVVQQQIATAINGAGDRQVGMGKSRVWGHRSLALAGKALPRTHRNRWGPHKLVDTSVKDRGAMLHQAMLAC